MSHNTSNVIADTLGLYFNTTVKKCRSYKGFYPNLTPIIYGLSQYSSNQNVYTLVYLNGLNILPYGSTTLNFGSFKNIPFTYLSSFNISFSVPINAIKGTYYLQLLTQSTTPLLPMNLSSNIVEYIIE